MEYRSDNLTESLHTRKKPEWKVNFRNSSGFFFLQLGIVLLLTLMAS